jgi:chromosome segregation ATPase
MNLLKKLKNIRSLTQKISELEDSLREKNDCIMTLETENASLQERLKVLVFRYKDVESEKTAMHFRLYQLTRENKILTMKLSGTTAQREGLKLWIQQMRKKHDDGK